MARPEVTETARPSPAYNGQRQPANDPAADGLPRLRVMLPIAAIISVAFAGSVIVTPLYSLYQHKFGFSEITLTLVYSVYAVGNVLALLLFGQISDQIGRKRAAVPALILASVSAALFLFAAGTSWLFFGRTLIGLAVGVASGTGTAWLAELYGPSRRPRATLTATTANLAGIGLGPVAGGLLAEYARWPLRLVFLCYIACVMLLATAVARLPATEGPTRAAFPRFGSSPGSEFRVT